MGLPPQTLTPSPNSNMGVVSPPNIVHLTGGIRPAKLS